MNVRGSSSAIAKTVKASRAIQRSGASQLAEFGLASGAAPDGCILVPGFWMRMCAGLHRQPSTRIPALRLQLRVVPHDRAFPFWRHVSVLGAKPPFVDGFVIGPGFPMAKHPMQVPAVVARTAIAIELTLHILLRVLAVLLGLVVLLPIFDQAASSSERVVVPVSFDTLLA